MLDPMNIYRDPVKIRLIDDPGLFAVHFDSVLPAAIGFGAGLLGSRGGGGGSGPSVATTQQDVLRPGQISSIDKLTGFLNPQIGQAPRVPGTQLGPVGPGALQQQAFGLAQQLPGQMQFDPQQITSAMQPVGDYAINLFQNRISPDIMNTLGGAGVARSSGAAEVLGRAGTGLASNIAAQFAPMQFQGFQAAQNRQANLPAQLANIGGIQQGFPAEQRAFDLQRFQAQDPLRNPALELALRTAGLSSFENQNVVTPGTPGMFQQLLPLAGQTIGAAGAAGGFGNLFQWN